MQSCESWAGRLWIRNALKGKYRRCWYIQNALESRKTEKAHRVTFWLCKEARKDSGPVGFFCLKDCYVWIFALCWVPEIHEQERTV